MIDSMFRSPLSTVSLGIDLLIDELNNNSAGLLDRKVTLEILQDLKVSSDIATHTLNDMLAFNKLQSGKMEVEICQENAWEFVKNCVKPFHLQAKSANINIKLIITDNLDKNTVGIMIDKNKLEVILRNFLANALKFSPKSTEVIVKLSSYDINEHKMLRISVTDAGPGISKVRLTIFIKLSSLSTFTFYRIILINYWFVVI